MWKFDFGSNNYSKPSTLSKKRKFRHVESKNLNSMVQEDRQKLEAEQEKRGAALREKLQKTKSELADLPTGFMYQKERQRLLQSIQTLETDLAECESKKALAKFDANVTPFLQAYEEEREAHLMEQNAPPKKRRNFGIQSANANSTRVCPSGGSSPSEGPSPGTSPSSMNDRVESIIEEYVCTVREDRPPPVQSANHDVCMDCEIPTMLVSNSATMVCPQCGTSSQYLDANFASVYCKDNEHAFHYKRINHLNDWLLLVQAKESQTVPQEVLDKVMAKLAEERITVPEVRSVSNDKIRKVLKSMRLRKYYDNVPQIRYLVTGIPPPQMTPYQEERCRLRFLVIQQPFNKHRPKDRKNFLSYPFVLYKICEIEGWKQFLPCFRLPKGDDKRKQQDDIWEKICNEVDGQDPTMRWPFYPTPAPSDSYRVVITPNTLYGHTMTQRKVVRPTSLRSFAAKTT
jgi:hypothetical protein